MIEVMSIQRALLPWSCVTVCLIFTSACSTNSPKTGSVVKENKSTEAYSGVGGIPGGVPGVESNIPGYQAVVGGNLSYSKDTDNEDPEIKTLQGKKVETYTGVGGIPGGVPGVESNIPGYQAVIGGNLAYNKSEDLADKKDPILQYPLYIKPDSKDSRLFYYDGELMMPLKNYRVERLPDGTLKIIPEPPADPNAKPKLQPLNTGK